MDDDGRPGNALEHFSLLAVLAQAVSPVVSSCVQSDDNLGHTRSRNSEQAAEICSEASNLGISIISCNPMVLFCTVR